MYIYIYTYVIRIHIYIYIHTGYLFFLFRWLCIYVPSISNEIHVHPSGHSTTVFLRAAILYRLAMLPPQEATEDVGFKPTKMGISPVKWGFNQTIWRETW
jgi:hypothetical protein